MIKAEPQPDVGHAQTGELTQLLQVIVTCAAMMENKCVTRAYPLVYMRARSMLPRAVPGVALKLPLQCELVLKSGERTEIWAWQRGRYCLMCEPALHRCAPHGHPNLKS